MMIDRYKYILWGVLAAMCGCSAEKQLAKKKYTFVLTNPIAIERADELVVLTRAMLEEKMGGLGEGKFISVTGPGKETISLQFDDLNRDGKWDEVAFLQKFEPNQKIALTAVATMKPPPTGTMRAHVRMRRKNEDDSFGAQLDSVSILAGTQPTDFSKAKLPLYLTEGPAWENDKVAFRLYLDTRNTVDIYGKTTPKMMMDTVGANPADSYHNLSPWGMDILAVGRSLGAGSLAVQVKNNGRDTLVRLGGNAIEKTTFKKVADGPVRAIFTMEYLHWQVLQNLPPVDVTEEISIWGGKYFYETKITVSNASAGAQLVTGIVNLKSKEYKSISAGKSSVLYTYDAQSENKDKLGMAVMMRKEQVVGFGKTPDKGTNDIENTYTVTAGLQQQPVSFRFYAGWELSDLLFAHEESFAAFLVNEAKKYDEPVRIE